MFMSTPGAKVKEEGPRYVFDDNRTGAPFRVLDTRGVGGVQVVATTGTHGKAELVIDALNFFELHGDPR